MSREFRPLLTEGRPGFLDRGDGESIPCLIAGFMGRSVFLQVDDGLLADVRTVGGRKAAVDTHLLIEHGGTMRSMRGNLVRGNAAGTAVLHLTDRFAGQRRTFSRAPLVLPAHVHAPTPAASAWRTFTRDVSAGGMRLARQSPWDGSMRLDVTLKTRDGSTFDVTAEVLAVYEASLGMRFLAIGDDARAALAQLTVDFHRTH